MSEDWNQIIGQLQAVMDDEVANDRECGCQLVIYQHGKKVVDLCAGYTSPDKTEAITRDHLFPIFSCGKAVLATAALQGLDKGYYTLNTPIADIWKGFEVNGKGDITIEHVLSHRSGLQAIPPMKEHRELADWDLMCKGIENAAPATPAGKVCAYHGVTFAYTVGRPLEIADGRPLREIIRKEIFEKCGIENDFYFGVDADAEKRVVDIVDAPDIEVRPTWNSKTMNDPVFRRTCAPSYNGCATANGLARFYAGLGGDLPGVKLLKPETFAAATSSHRRDPGDPVTESWTRFGLGIVLWGMGAEPGILIGHGGASGSEGYYFREKGLAVGFVKNLSIKNHPHHIVRDRIAEILGVPIRHW